MFKDPHFESAIAVRHSRLGQAGGHYTRLACIQTGGSPWEASTGLILGRFPSEYGEAAIDEVLARS